MPRSQPHAVTVHAINYMLQAEHPLPIIQRVTGANFKTIRAIARDPERYITKPAKAENVPIRHYFHPDAILTNPGLTAHYEQCPTCRQQVILPCVACEARRYRRRQAAPRQAG